MLDLKGKTVLLTGASKGIGAATARILGEAGATLVAHYGADRAGAEAATKASPSERRLFVAERSSPAERRRRRSGARRWPGGGASTCS